MKRFFAFLLITILLLGGCASQGQLIREPVRFYYPQSQFQYGNNPSILDWEERESSGHRGDLQYLIALYLMGPSSGELSSPLPVDTRLLSVEQEETNLMLTLSEVPLSMPDSVFSLACACLAKTCMGLTDTDRVTVISGSRSVTIGPDNLILTDSMETSKMEEPQ